MLIVLLTGFIVFGQNPLRTVNRGNGQPEIPDTLTLLFDSLLFARDSISVTDSLLRLDSIVRADSLFRLDSLDLLRKSSLEQPAFSGAKDSVRQDFSNGQRKMYYWGDVTVTYGNLKLSAEYMEYDMNTGIVFAKGIYDSLSRTWKGSRR